MHYPHPNAGSSQLTGATLITPRGYLCPVNEAHKPFPGEFGGSQGQIMALV